MKTLRLIFVIIVLINVADCLAQDSLVSRTFKKDSATISTGVVYYDVDLKINELDKELDSLYKVYQFKNPSVKVNLMANSKKVKDYIGEFINNGGFYKNENSTRTDFLYNGIFRNSTLSQELEKYIQSINDLDINATVKKVAIQKVQPIRNSKVVNSYTHKYNTALTVLKIQLYNVIWSEVYVIDNESVGK